MKKVGLLLLLLVCLLVANNAYATSVEDNSVLEKYSASPELSRLYQEGQLEKVDYYNPETGEYFAWLKPYSIKTERAADGFTYVRPFEFNIRHTFISR